MAQRRLVYKWFYDTLHSRWYDHLLRWILLPFGGERRFRRDMTQAIDFTGAQRILDLCCGTGSCARAIRERVGNTLTLVGVDLSIGQLKVARQKHRSASNFFVEADGAELPFGDDCFDIVVIPHALHEMPHESRKAVLHEAKRVAKPNGQVVALELDNPASLGRRMLLGLWLGYWLPYPLNFENPTRRDMIKRGLVNEFRDAGFSEISKVSKFKGTMQVVIGRVRQSAARGSDFQNAV